MRKLLLVFVMMALWMVAGCETVRQVKSGCFGHWVESRDGARSGHKRGTIYSNKNNIKPYRQCVDEDSGLDLEKRPYG